MSTALKEPICLCPEGMILQANLQMTLTRLLPPKEFYKLDIGRGSGLSIMLDILASILSKGKSTAEISKLPAETALSQVFICFEASKLGEMHELHTKINEIATFYKSSVPQQDDELVRFPGEATILRRNRNKEFGVEVDPKIWSDINKLLSD